MHAAIAFFVGINWGAVLSGAALATISLGVRSVMQAPLKALTERQRFVRLLWFVSPQKPFNGVWEVSWKVISSRFPPTNTDVVPIRSLFGNVTFTTTAHLNDGTDSNCVFVGKLAGLTMTGRWFDPSDEERGYFGVYQVRLHGGLRSARGTWIGWANDGTVQSGEMIMQRVS